MIATTDMHRRYTCDQNGGVHVRTPVGRLSVSTVLVANVAFWPAWTAFVGWAAQRTPDARFAHDDVITRERSIERGGDFYRDDLAINRWKDRLPEAGSAYGGFTKRTVAGGNPAVMERFLLETRRAECAHWAMAAGWFVTLLWNPWWAAGVNATVAASSNLPCIAVQRHNRLRLRRALDAVRSRATSSR
jgi:glycosyl-4,4'-diaponeurosporenoate acyltransferase